MRRPRVPPMLADIVQTALSACEGAVFDSRDACPSCGGELSGYDTKKKRFAVLMEGEKRHAVNVFVKRFYCRRCNEVFFADEPFYPDTRIGSPVIDLCVTLSATMPYTRAATYLSKMGVVIDRGSVRNYAHRGFFNIPTAEIFGIRLPMSIVSLSTLAARVSEKGCVEGAEALAACGFPSADRTALHVPLAPQQGDERDEQNNKEERQVQEPHHHGYGK